VLSCVDVSKSFGALSVVRHISLEIPAGGIGQRQESWVLGRNRVSASESETDVSHRVLECYPYRSRGMLPPDPD